MHFHEVETRLQTRPVFVFCNTNTYLKYKYCIWKTILNTVHKQSIWKVFKYFFLPKYLQILFLTHEILFIPSSALYERLFSFGSIIPQGRRGRLTDENLEKLIVSSQLFKLNKLSGWSCTHTSMMSVFKDFEYLESI